MVKIRLIHNHTMKLIMNPFQFTYYTFSLGHAVAQLVWHCATSRKVAGSIPDGVTGIFH